MGFYFRDDLKIKMIFKLFGGIIFLIQKNLTIIMAPVIVHCAVQDWKCNFWSCFAKL